MKTWLRHTLFTVSLIGGTAGLVVLNSVRKAEEMKYTCPKMVVESAENLHFLTADYITKRVENVYGSCIGRRPDSISLNKVEQCIKAVSVVKCCQAWITQDRIMHLTVSERVPLAKFINEGSGYYADADSVVFPLYDNYDAPVTVVYGPVRPDRKDEMMALANLCSRLEGEADWAETIDTIRVDSKGYITIRPSGSTVRYLFGNTEDIDGKIDRMRVWRDKLAAKCVDKEYAQINVEFSNRLICK